MRECVCVSVCECVWVCVCVCVCVCVLDTRSCPALWDPMDHSPPHSSVHGISPGKNTGVGCHFLLQGIFSVQGLNLGLLHCRQILYRLCHQGSGVITRSSLQEEEESATPRLCITLKGEASKPRHWEGERQSVTLALPRRRSQGKQEGKGMYMC